MASRVGMRLSRKANSLSSGRYWAGSTPERSVRDSGFSFKRVSALNLCSLQGFVPQPKSDRA